LAAGSYALEPQWDRNVSQQVLSIGVKDVASYRHQYIVGVEQLDPKVSMITAMYSTVPYNAAPLALNVVSNALLKSKFPKDKSRIIVENHPMQNGTEVIFQIFSLFHFASM
jgi:hypothetical protein